MNTAKWDQKIQALIEEYGIVALSVAVTDREKTIWSKAYGVTSIEKPWDQNTTDTLYRIASCTKMTVGILTMQLVEQGVLDLDKPIGTYVPWFKMADRSTESRITLRRLLSHSAGLPSEYTPDGPNDEDKLEATLQEGFAQLKPIADPNDKLYYYCNWGIRLVSYVLQTVTGIPFSQLVKERVLKPLGMDHTAFALNEVATFSLAVPHASRTEALHYIPVNATRYAAGGLFSTVNDMAKLARLLLNGGAPLIRPESLAQMMTPESSLYLTPTNQYGLTMRLRQYKDILICGHDGQSPPYYCSIWTVPAKGYAVTFTLNTEGGNILSTDLVPKLILDDLLELPETEELWSPGEYHPEIEAKHEGEYLNDAQGLSALRIEDGKPVLYRGEARFPLTAHANAGLYYTDPADGAPVCVGLPGVNGSSTEHMYIGGVFCRKIIRQTPPEASAYLPCEGQYGEPHDRYSFTVENGALLVRRGGGVPVPCHYIEPDTFASDLGTMRFAWEQGRIVGVRVGIWQQMYLRQ